jgi:uncharacterized membrane protein
VSDNPVQLLVAGFQGTDTAKAKFSELKAFKKETGAIRILDAAWLWKDDNGKLKIRETRDMSTGRGMAMGGVLGGVVGVLTGGVGLAVAAGGGAIGGLISKFRDSGFDNARLELAGSQLPAGSSMLIVAVEHTWVGDIENILQQAGADITTLAVSGAIAAELEAGNDAFVTVTADSEAVYVGAGTGSPNTARIEE